MKKNLSIILLLKWPLLETKMFTVYNKIGNPIVLGPLSKQVAYYNDDDVLCILQPSNS